MKRFEFQIGLYVDAENDEAALEKIGPLMDLANELDPEEDAVFELVGTEDI